MPRKQKLSNVVTVRMTDDELERLDALAELCNISRSEMLKKTVKYSGGAIRKKFLKEFVEGVEAMADPFDTDPVFDNRDIPLEEKVLEKCLAWDKEVKSPGSTERRVKGKKAAGDKLNYGLSPHDVRNQIDDSDRKLAEQYERLTAKPTPEDLAEEKRWWDESGPKP